MGSILSRRIAGVKDIDIQANSAYRYPPKSGELPRTSAAEGGWNGEWGRQEARVLDARAPALPRTLPQCPFLVPVELEAWLRPWLALLASVAPCAVPF